MTIPNVSHKQFLVLAGLLRSPRSGRDLRDHLGDHGVRTSLAAFYQLMARLEDAGLVSGWYELKHVDGQTFKERRYEITESGRREWEDVRDFYTVHIGTRSRDMSRLLVASPIWG